MYFLVKLSYLEPKPHTDQMKRVKNQYLVNALSCTEAELRMNKWVPDNYQDAVVEEVKHVKIDNVYCTDPQSSFWLSKLTTDNDGRTKLQSFFVVLNNLSIEEAVRKLRTDYSFADIEEIKKFKSIVDEDLIKEEIKKEAE